MAVQFPAETELGVRYVLEHRKGGSGAGVLHELSWVERVEIDELMSASVRYPMDEKAPGIVQRSVTRMWSITLSGATGVDERFSSTKDGKTAVLDGLGRINALREFLRGFSSTAAHQEGAFQRVSRPDQLFLHVIYEGVTYQLVTADLKRSVSVDQAIGDFIWTLTCKAIKLVERELPQTLPLSRLYALGDQWTAPGAEAVGAVEDPSMDRAGAVGRSSWDDLYDPFDTAALAVAKGDALSDSELGVFGQRAQSAVARVNRLLLRVEDARENIRRAGEFPGALISSALRAVSDAMEELTATSAELALLPVPAGGGGVVDAVTRFHDLSATYGDLYIAWAGVLASLRVPLSLAPVEGGEASPPPESVATGLAVTLGVLVRPVITLEGESIYDLALRMLGDAERWNEIATLNGLSDVWTLRDGSPFTAGGAILLVPDPDGVAPPRTGDIHDLIGETYYLDPTTSDLVMRDGGFQRVRGQQLVIQAIRERARATRGGCPAAPDWGLLPLVGSASSRDTAVRFAVDARAQFFRDPRVLAVENVSLSQVGDTVVLSLDIETIGIEEPVTVTAPLATARS